MRIRAVLPILPFILIVFPFWQGCGVKGDPIPYVQAYPETVSTPPAVPPPQEKKKR